MSASREKLSTNAAREFVASLVRLHGRKRGLGMAASTLGVSESWARKIHYGEAAAVSEDVADRAAAARADVLRARHAAARREIAEIERMLGGHDLESSDALGVSAVGGAR